MAAIRSRSPASRVGMIWVWRSPSNNARAWLRILPEGRWRQQTPEPDVGLPVQRHPLIGHGSGLLDRALRVLDLSVDPGADPEESFPNRVFLPIHGDEGVMKEVELFVGVVREE